MHKQPYLTLLDPHAEDEPFPPVDMAWEEPNGLLAIGGNLNITRLLTAYRSGIFPWYSADEPIYWWSPNPRAVIYPHNINFPRSLRKIMRNKGYCIRFDGQFPAVVNACAAPRAKTEDTWITPEMYHAYCHLFRLGHAHSVEVYNKNKELVGGLYGVAANGVFSGESMFSREPSTSKLALIALAYHLQQWGFHLIDCQVESPHLMRMGAENISRKHYLKILRATHTPKVHWRFNTKFDLSQWQPEKTLFK